MISIGLTTKGYFPGLPTQMTTLGKFSGVITVIPIDIISVLVDAAPTTIELITISLSLQVQAITNIAISTDSDKNDLETDSETTDLTIDSESVNLVVDAEKTNL